MTDPQVPTIRTRATQRSNRDVADYVYQAATLAAVVLLLLTAAL